MKWKDIMVQEETESSHSFLKRELLVDEGLQLSNGHEAGKLLKMCSAGLANDH